MGFLSFNKLPRHRTFRYIPRYYDPQKEQLQAIIDNAKNEGNFDDIEKTKNRIRQRIRSNHFGGLPTRKQVLNSNIRLILIIAFLCALAFIFLNFNLDKLINYIG